MSTDYNTTEPFFCDAFERQIYTDLDIEESDLARNLADKTGEPTWMWAARLRDIKRAGYLIIRGW